MTAPFACPSPPCAARPPTPPPGGPRHLSVQVPLPSAPLLAQAIVVFPFIQPLTPSHSPVLILVTCRAPDTGCQRNLSLLVISWLGLQNKPVQNSGLKRQAFIFSPDFVGQLGGSACQGWVVWGLASSWLGAPILLLAAAQRASSGFLTMVAGGFPAAREQAPKRKVLGFGIRLCWPPQMSWAENLTPLFFQKVCVICCYFL